MNRDKPRLPLTASAEVLTNTKALDAQFCDGRERIHSLRSEALTRSAGWLRNSNYPLLYQKQGLAPNAYVGSEALPSAVPVCGLRDKDQSISSIGATFVQ